MICPYCKKAFDIHEERMRSLPQQRYYFGVIVKILSEHMGYTILETHEIMKAMFLSEIKIVTTKAGAKEVKIVKSTTEITTIEAEEYYSQIRIWASAELGCWIPEPNEVISENP